MNYQTLKAKQRATRDPFPDALGLRVHRALSWLNKAEQCKDDKDAQFTFLWISFNAAYAQSLESSRFSELETLQLFLDKLCRLDKKEQLHHLLWNEFTSSIRLLIDNQYVFQPFWNYHNGKISNREWKDKFSAAKRKANKALANNDSTALLTVVLARLYTLRNQIIHGGATWNSSANREQLRDVVNFLSKLVPMLIEIMMEHPEALWGDAHYPVIKYRFNPRSSPSPSMDHQLL